MRKKVIYRELINPGNLFSFEVSIKESDLLVLADKNLPKQTEEALIWCRKDIEQYIYQNPIFKTSFEPIPVKEDMPPIVRAMTEAAQKANVGPMAAVAGAIAEFVGKKLLGQEEKNSRHLRWKFTSIRQDCYGDRTSGYSYRHLLFSRNFWAFLKPGGSGCGSRPFSFDCLG